MRGFADLLRRFQSDERGVFLVIFGLLAVVLIAAAGAVVDFTSIQQSRTRAQLALDSAALGLQPTIFQQGVTAETLRTRVQALLDERLADTSVTSVVGVPTIDTQLGQLRLEARITVPTAFVQLVGFPTVDANLVAEARRRQLNLEVVMVLDNSGSMGNYSRMANLKAAARCATNVLLNDDCDSVAVETTSPNVHIGIVPFTEFVNVGTGNRNATWMDGAGNAPVSQDNFDDDNNSDTAFASPVNRFTLYSNLGINWSGCVEARDHVQAPSGLYYDTSDVEPDVLTPQSLFTPVFAPDQPDSGGYANSYISDTPNACPSRATYTWTEARTECRYQMYYVSDFGDNCTGPTTNTYEQTVNGVTTATSSTRPSEINGASEVASSSTYYNRRDSYYGYRRYSHLRVREWTYDFSDQEKQERLCKYVVGASVSWLSSGPGGRTGPNADCPSAAMLPLTDTKASVTSKIEAMNSNGGTNIHQGVMWGFHMLSPTEPLTEAGAYQASRSKAMIIMTDGENTHSRRNDFAGADWYTAYGYPYSGRLTGNSTYALETEMNARTEATCTNAKAAGIIIYTVGLSPPTQATRDMLLNCASDGSKAKFPSSPDELTQVFEDIATQLSNLRLAE
ncbi:pilus assembly protein TadG-related protein [Devosia sp.]|uniref:pilus assembly protein TadG-related protein n=1 Tax=Devosia sp. TaxID=1871048 RepID=UPI003A8F3DF8